MEQLGGGRLGRSEVGRNIDAGEEIAHMVTKIVMLRSEIANLLASLILYPGLRGKIVHHVGGGGQCL